MSAKGTHGGWRQPPPVDQSIPEAVGIMATASPSAGRSSQDVVSAETARAAATHRLIMGLSHSAAHWAAAT